MVALPVTTVARSVIFGFAWAIDCTHTQIRTNAAAPHNNACANDTLEALAVPTVY